ncbi:RNA polymerase sigma factor [Frigoriglobus tundricola]|nr:sigma-70 family RNA polymerase sigma factor [Frigoriglobus tundricola]
MNRVLNRLCDQLTDVRSVPDRPLLDRFLTDRDEAAFAELVRRYGPLVWGACRRWLANVQDAEDAFQAAFLVLVRRAGCLSGDAPIGPWLYQVAVMTARNLTRGNRRRGAITGPMEYEVPAPGAVPSAERLDLDAALLALPERDRRAVILCHVLGLTRREAAERLGCPEGTLSARLNRALRRLRTRLGGSAPAVLTAATIAVPAGLTAATVRSATIYSTSILASVGVSPAVVRLTDGVLRMFWMKKAMTAAVAAVLVVGAGVLALGTAGRSENTARATEPPAAVALPAAEEPDTLKRLELQLADLEKQKRLLDATLDGLKVEKQKLEAAQKAREAVAEAAELGKRIAVAVGPNNSPSPYLVREVVNGRVGEMTCSSLDLLTTYLTRAHRDPKGPKELRISAYKDCPTDQLRSVFAACAAAGYGKAAFSHTAKPFFAHLSYEPRFTVLREEVVIDPTPAEALPKPGEIDLTKYAPKKP